MPKSSPHPDVSQQAEANPSRWSRGIRFLLMALIVAVGCNVAYGFGKWLARWRHIREASTAAAEPQEPIELGPASAVLPLAGPWSFDSLEWNLRSQLLEEKEIDNLFKSLSLMAPAIEESKLPETDPAILDLITALRIRPVELAGNQIFRLDRPDFKTQLVVRKANGHTKTVAFAIAYPQTGSKWQLYEFEPGSKGSSAGSSAPHLLPLPATARRDGGRYDEAGRLLLELVSLESSGEQLLASWRHSGWEVNANDFVDTAQFSFLCRRGNDVIYAWSADPHDSLRNLMLVRTPSVADTGR